MDAQDGAIRGGKRYWADAVEGGRGSYVLGLQKGEGKGVDNRVRSKTTPNNGISGQGDPDTKFI